MSQPVPELTLDRKLKTLAIDVVSGIAAAFAVAPGIAIIDQGEYLLRNSRRFFLSYQIGVGRVFFLTPCDYIDLALTAHSSLGLALICNSTSLYL